MLSVLINKKGYFGGRRPNLQAWRAVKHVGEPTGCRISLVNPRVPGLGVGTIILQDVYRGPLPRSATDTALGDWIAKRLGSVEPTATDRFGVGLAFGDRKLNLGDIATGRVKSVIDNLYPIVGGRVGAPEDWKITSLTVTRYANLDQDQMLITVVRQAKGGCSEA